MSKIINPYRFAAPPGGGGNGFLTGLVADYDLTEASGTRSDNHGSYDLTEIGGTITGSAAGADFVAANADYLNNNSGPSFPNATISVSMWVDADVEWNNDGLFEIGSEAILIWLGTNMFFRVEGAAVNVAYSPPVGEEINIVCTSSSAARKVFVNGVLRGYQASTVTSEITSSVLRLGTQAAVRFFDGRMRRVSIFNRTLSDGGVTTVGNSATAGSDIDLMYNSGTPLEYSEYD